MYDQSCQNNIDTAMTIFFRSFFAVLTMFLIGLQAQSAELCLSADKRCTEWVSMGEGPQRGLVYRTHALTEPQEAIQRAVIVIHGQGRNADGYFRHALAGGFLSDALKETLILSPRFASNEGRNCRDKLDVNEVGWICLGPESWRSGGEQATPSEKKVHSFDFMDSILTLLSDRKNFPNLRSIVIAGHSAGGQYVSRYQMANDIHEKLKNEKNIQLTYIVSNPSSYTYTDVLRPTRSATPATISALAPGYVPVAPSPPPPPFATFNDAKGCASFNSWPYGIENKVGAVASMPNDVLKKNLATRPVTFLLGELDILPLYGFDSSCAAMAQGPTRLARGFAYVRFVNETYQSNHAAIMVPACGHDARCMFTAEKSLPYLFLR
ncbi:hypothetical protein [Zwartia panacis]|uniref:hypothetical protein n=1 Tax=Zwartia panacis TaxID=2683345 RepID=UPI0025B336FF|nr:hypothetical protein [Zwartia panacis]MDN4017890.1 hypothetical protein [Zwartia panacis]